MGRFVKDIMDLRIVKDSQGKDVYLNNNGSATVGSSDVYLDRPIRVNKAIGNYQKGEVVLEGTSLNEILGDLFSTKARVNPYKTLNIVTDYLAYVEYDELDYNYALKYFKDVFGDNQEGLEPIIPGGACSSIKKGNLYGRNYDYFYDESEEFVIKVSATPSRHASIGVSTCYFDKDDVEAGGYNYKYKVLPFFTLDGINDCGVVCNVNMLTKGQFKTGTIGTNPNAKVDICSLMLIRYVLDNFSSAKKAVKAIKNDINFFVANNADVHDEYHYMIADANNTYIVEFINNEVVVNDLTNTKGIMTNYYYKNSKYNTDGTVNMDSILDFSVGIERYNILNSHYDNITDSASMRNALKDCQFTRAYLTDTNPVWYTDYVGVWPEFGTFTIKTPHEQFAPLIADQRQKHLNRTRNRQMWQTLHSSIYDIQNKTLKICVQEDWNHEYTYSL